MIQRHGRRHLSLWRHTRPDLMALVASYLLMFRMTEADAESWCKFSSAPVASQLMARFA
jgi:hypothetical protein